MLKYINSFSNILPAIPQTCLQPFLKISLKKNGKVPMLSLKSFATSIIISKEKIGQLQTSSFDAPYDCTHRQSSPSTHPFYMNTQHPHLQPDQQIIIDVVAKHLCQPAPQNSLYVKSKVSLVVGSCVFSMLCSRFVRALDI
jgi:hypothetical protein